MQTSIIKMNTFCLGVGGSDVCFCGLRFSFQTLAVIYLLIIMVYKVCFKKETFITKNIFIYLYLFKINNVFSGRDAEIINVLYAKTLLAFAQKMLIFAEKCEELTLAFKGIRR